MIGRLVLASGLALAGAMAFSPNVLAQSVDVPFEGNIGESCSFATPVPGVLVYSGGGPGNPPPDVITSMAPGGVSGTVDVSCNTQADLQITDARFVSFTPTDPNVPPTFPPPGSQAGLEAWATVPGANTQYSGTGNPSPPMPIFPTSNAPLRQTVEVDLEVYGPGPLKAGIYQYAVTLTIVQ
ncbi:MAG: hypothetical protein RIB93_33460 [Coleofasciculus sp. D1-CHI-01]|uniref:hypothetical protein n=1 Tax=Coleofasciculus sp. D1-CHI-01 TaxID=3068482 RepID=UPI0032F5D3AA